MADTKAPAAAAAATGDAAKPKAKAEFFVKRESWWREAIRYVWTSITAHWMWLKWGDPVRFQPQLHKAMAAFDEYLKKHDIEYWMDYGNILGAVRHERLIPWDHDLDAGCTVDAYAKFEATVKAHPLPAPLEAYSAPGSGYTMVWYENAVWCDLVPYRFDAARNAWISACEGAQCHDPTDRENYCVPIAAEWLYPLKQAKLGDRSYPVPADCDSYLKTQYGNYWSFLWIPVFWSWLYHPVLITRFVWHYLTRGRAEQQAKFLNKSNDKQN